MLWRQVMPTRGYLSQSELPVTVGLGNDTSIREVEIQWPGGKRQTLLDFKIDQLNRVIEPAE